MKITVWVVSTCIPGEPEPSLPAVFGTDAAAEAYADEMMRGEWDSNGPRDEETDELLPYPGDWWEAQDQIVAYQTEVGSDEDDIWGRWEITSHQVEIGSTSFAALEDAVRELDEAADKFHVIHCNHPGERAGRAQGEDKAFCATMSDRMRAARERVRLGLVNVAADRLDGERWRALMSSARMHFMGSAGFKHVPKDGDAGNRQLVNQTPVPRDGQPLHFGMEFWDVGAVDDRFPDTFERELLTVYVDAIRERAK